MAFTSATADRPVVPIRLDAIPVSDSAQLANHEEGELNLATVLLCLDEARASTSGRSHRRPASVAQSVGHDSISAVVGEARLALDAPATSGA